MKSMEANEMKNLMWDAEKKKIKCLMKKEIEDEK